MPSFYVGITEEPNINYVIYLQWLYYIYVDYLQVFREALPQMPADSGRTVLNESFILGYLTNPGYAYYPVVNLSWPQVQRYLAWKTDRLNEAILLENKILPFTAHLQVNEESFNTESYMLAQYSGLQSSLDYGYSKKKVPATEFASSYNLSKSFNSGILSPGFRLPTEAEWEYIYKQQILPLKDLKQPTLPNYLFGQNYFLFRWSPEVWEKRLSLYRRNYFVLSGNTSWGPDIINIAYPLKSVRMELTSVSDSSQPKIVRSILKYPQEFTGPIQLEDGVREWLLDAYDTIPNLSSTWLEVFKLAGFDTNPREYDGDGCLLEKDSLGRMNFRSFGVFPNGGLIRISHAPIGKIRNRVVKGGTWAAPGKYRSALPEDQSSPDVGFRCVLPYMGTPVLKGNKVKW